MTAGAGTFAGTAGNASPFFTLNATSANATFNWVSQAFASNLAAGNNLVHFIGQAASTKNSAYLGFKYAGADSNDNILTLGLYGVDNILNINGLGNVGIGTASPTELLDIRGANRDQSSGQFNQVIYSTSSQDELRGGSIGFGGFYTGTSLSTTFGAIKGFKENGFGDNTAGALAFYSRPNGGAMTERMRITSGGAVCVNRSTSLLSSVFSIDQFGSASTNIALNHFYTGNKYIDFGWYGTSIGSITNISGTAVSFNTSSDYRLKEDLQEINGLEKIQDIKVYNYKWKGHDFRMDGVLAHELSEVLPYAVHGEKDAVDEEGNDKMQGVDYSKIVPILIKAIQELKTEIDSLKNQIK